MGGFAGEQKLPGCQLCSASKAEQRQTPDTICGRSDGPTREPLDGNPTGLLPCTSNPPVESLMASEHYLAAGASPAFPQRRMSDPTRYKTRMCHFILRGHPCPDADSCTFAHHETELRKGAVAATLGGQGAHGGAVGKSNPALRNPRFKTRICVHWAKSNGRWCPLGDRCKFAHGEVRGPVSPSAAWSARQACPLPSPRKS